MAFLYKFKLIIFNKKTVITTQGSFVLCIWKKDQYLLIFTIVYFQENSYMKMPHRFVYVSNMLIDADSIAHWLIQATFVFIIVSKLAICLLPLEACWQHVNLSLKGVRNVLTHAYKTLVDTRNMLTTYLFVVAKMHHVLNMLIWARNNLGNKFIHASKMLVHAGNMIAAYNSC